MAYSLLAHLYPHIRGSQEDIARDIKTIKKALQDGWNTPKMQRLFL